MSRTTQSLKKNQPMGEVESLAFEATLAPLVISRYRVVVNCNIAFAQMFGYAREDLVGSSLAMLYPSYDDFAKIGKRGLSKMKSCPHYTDERMMKRRDNTVFWCSVRGVTMSPDNPYELAVWSFEHISRCAPDVSGLSPREREVAAYIGEGLTSKEIGIRLKLSHRTIERHRARLMRKLGTPNAAALVAEIISLTDEKQ